MASSLTTHIQDITAYPSQFSKTGKRDKNIDWKGKNKTAFPPTKDIIEHIEHPKDAQKY